MFASKFLPIMTLNRKVYHLKVINVRRFLSSSSPLFSSSSSPSSSSSSSSSSSPSSSSASSSNEKDQSKPNIKVVFHKSNGQKLVGYGRENEHLLDVVINNHLDIDGFGACEGTLACSTCHLIFKEEDFKKINSKPTDEELDMLDLAYGLTETSRLGCQVTLTKELDGVEVYVPETVNDARTS